MHLHCCTTPIVWVYLDNHPALTPFSDHLIDIAWALVNKYPLAVPTVSYNSRAILMH